MRFMSILTGMVLTLISHIKNSASCILITLALFSACKPKEAVVLKQVKDIVVDATDQPLLRANALLYNPNNEKAKLRKIKIDVFVDGKKAARIDQTLRQQIPAQADFTLPLEIQLDLKELGLKDVLQSVFLGKKLKVRYTGSIKITYHGLPVSIPVDYESEVKIRL
jgi:LEA14-like dessication related protein